MSIAVIVLVGLAAWIATSTIVEAEVFRDVREACQRCHDRYNNWWTYKLQYLVRCHMCTGIWVASIIAIFLPPIASSGLVGWGLTALAIKGIAHLALVVQKVGESVSGKNEAITAKAENEISQFEEKVSWLEQTRHSHKDFETWKRERNANGVG